MQGIEQDVIAILKAIDASSTQYGRLAIDGKFPRNDVSGNEVEDSLVLFVFGANATYGIQWDEFEADDLYQLADQRFSFIFVHVNGEVQPYPLPERLTALSNLDFPT
jgi:hypothetical protein